MSSPVDIRPMEPGDVARAEIVWQEAFAGMRRRANLPERRHDEHQAERTCRRLRYFLGSDPGGSWVAVGGDEVVGVAQASKRGPLWLLSLFGVATRAQGRGVGRRLLDQALGYADRDGPGLILSSPDPRAMRRYVAAGFSLHPVVSAMGRVRAERLPPVDGVRAGTAADLDLVDKVDERVRGAARRGDIGHLLDDGVQLLVLEGRGYAMVRGAQPVMLAALDEAAARDLLVATLAGASPGQEVEVGWLSGDQQWAMDVVVVAGLELRPSGAIMVRGLPGPPRPYIPNGAFG